MAALLAWGLAVWGLTVIVTASSLFRPVRELAAGSPEANRPPGTPVRFLGRLLHCPMCFGFWVGAGLCLLGAAGPSWAALPAWPSGGLLGAPGWLGWPVRAVLDGASSAGLCWGVHVVLVRLGALDL